MRNSTNWLVFKTHASYCFKFHLAKDDQCSLGVIKGSQVIILMLQEFQLNMRFGEIWHNERETVKRFKVRCVANASGEQIYESSSS